MENVEKKPYKRRNLHPVDCILGAGAFVLLILAKDKLGGADSRYYYSEIAMYLFAAVVFLLFFYVLQVGGRIVAQLVCGGELLFLRVDNRIIIRQEDRLVKMRTLSEDRFFSYAVRPKAVTNKRYPFLAEALGGILPVLVVALVFGFLLLTNLERKGVFLVTCAFGLITGVFTFLREFLPYRNIKRLKSGEILFSGLFTPLSRRLLYNFKQVDAYSFDGVRLRNMPEEFFPECKAEKLSASFSLRARQLHAAYEMDRENFHIAQEILTELLAFAREKQIRTEEYSRDLIYLALLQGDKPCAKQYVDWYYQQAEQELKHLPEWARTKHARRLYEKYKDDGLGASFEEFRKKFRAYPFRGRIESEYELVTLVDAACRRISLGENTDEISP